MTRMVNTPTTIESLASDVAIIVIAPVVDSFDA